MDCRKAQDVAQAEEDRVDEGDEEDDYEDDCNEPRMSGQVEMNYSVGDEVDIRADNKPVMLPGQTHKISDHTHGQSLQWLHQAHKH